MPAVKQTAIGKCKICREQKEHYRWSDKALWTCVDVNSHPDVTDIKVLQKLLATSIEQLAGQEKRIDELEDEGLEQRSKIGLLLHQAQIALPRLELDDDEAVPLVAGEPHNEMGTASLEHVVIEYDGSTVIHRVQRLLEAIAELTDDNMPTLHAHHQTGIVGWGWNAHVKNESGHQASYGGALENVETMLRKELKRHQERLAEKENNDEDLRSGIEQGTGPGSVDDGADQGG